MSKQLNKQSMCLLLHSTCIGPWLMLMHVSMLIFSLCQQFERTQLLRLQRNENRNGKGRKSLQKWVDTSVAAVVEVLADLHQGTLTNLCYFSANVFLFF